MESFRRKILLRQVFESTTVSELLHWRSRELSDLEVRSYVEILVAYHAGDRAQLQSLANYLSLDETPQLYWLGNLRSRLLSQTIDENYLDHCLAHFPPSSDWDGELKFVAALAAERVGHPVLAANLFEGSARAFAALGAQKRKMRALERARELRLTDVSFSEEAEDGEEAAPKVSKLEAKFLRILRERPMTKFEAIESLFGRGYDHFAQFEDRFDKLVNSLQGKYPDLIRMQGSRYSA